MLRLLLVFTLLVVASVIAFHKEQLRKVLFLGIMLIGAAIYGVCVYLYYGALSRWLPQEVYGAAGIMSVAQYQGVSYVGEFLVLYLPWVFVFVLSLVFGVFFLRKRNVYFDENTASPSYARVIHQSPSLLRFTPNIVSIGLWFHVLFYLFGFIGQYQDSPSIKYIFILLAVSVCLGYLEKQVDAYFTHKYLLIHTKLVLACAAIYLIVQSVFMAITPVWLIGSIIVSGALYRRFRHSTWSKSWSLMQEALLVVFISFTVSFPHLLSCFTRVYDLGFDSQNYLTWFYAASRGFRPNIDIFYLYGYLTFFAEGLVWVRVLLWVYISSLFVAFFFVIKKMYQSSILAYILLGVLLVLISANSYLWAFYRYGTAPVIIGLFAWAFTKNTKYQKYATFVLGVISSGLYFLLTDQGMVLIVASLVLIFVDSTVIQRSTQEKRNLFVLFVAQSARYMLGLLLGASIFIVPLIRQGLVPLFLEFASANSKIILYGKLPYFVSSWQVRDIWISGSIWIAITLVVYVYICYFNKLRSMQMYALLGAICVLGIIQYKNTTRAIDNDILVPLYFVILSALSVVHLALTRKRVGQRWRVLWVSVCVLCCFLPDLSYSKVVRGVAVLQDSYVVSRARMARSIPVASQLAQCMRNPLSALPRASMEAYYEAVRWMKSQVGFNGKIYSYPGDPIFYVLLGQKPPPIFNAYDATPKASQELNVEFIDRNDIRYVVLNIANPNFMDGVPNLVRNAVLHKYIFTHYESVALIGQFVIMKRTQSTHDAFSGDAQLNYVFMNELINIDLRRIPKSEGSKLRKYESAWKRVETQKNSLVELNYQLQTRRISSRSLSVLFSFDPRDGLLGDDIVMQVESGSMVTSIKFEACLHPDVCMVHLDRLPLFYVNKPVTKITTSRPIYGGVQLIELMNDQVFW
ncbi:hypothetical protein KBC80_02810 [Candidatus Woesebacteria bacterium]|nr:hypothetical protein [Candidatus Woesebacteria bacterium]